MKLAALDLGSLRVDTPVFLAPMAGYTDSAFRILCRRYGCGMVFTEVVNAEALVRGRNLSLHMLETDPAERPAAAHLYGSKPEVMARAAAVAARLGRFDLVDINAGCPVPKIVAKGAGAALMKDPARIQAIVSAVREAVTLPVTVKTRIGLDPDRLTIAEVGRAAEAGGASALFVHARVASNRHSGEADWSALARVKAERAIPVIGNGGVEKAEDVFRMMERTGVDGVMIGRAAVGNPWIFREIRAMADGRPVPPRSFEELRAVIAEHLRRMTVLKAQELNYRRKSKYTPEERAALQFRAHLFRYLNGLRGCTEVRRRLQVMNTVEAIMAAVDDVIGWQADSGRIGEK